MLDIVVAAVVSHVSARVTDLINEDGGAGFGSAVSHVLLLVFLFVYLP